MQSLNDWLDSLQKTLKGSPSLTLQSCLPGTNPAVYTHIHRVRQESDDGEVEEASPSTSAATLALLPQLIDGLNLHVRDSNWDEATCYALEVLAATEHHTSVAWGVAAHPSVRSSTSGNRVHGAALTPDVAASADRLVDEVVAHHKHAYAHETPNLDAMTGNRRTVLTAVCMNSSRAYAHTTWEMLTCYVCRSYTSACGTAATGPSLEAAPTATPC